MNFSDLVGVTFSAIKGLEAGSDSVAFEVAGVTAYEMFHAQNCCESVSINDIDGDVADIIGSPITLAEEVDSDECGKASDKEVEAAAESFTWTFYRLGTVKGMVVIRWFGESNGYYSESVDICKV